MRTAIPYTFTVVHQQPGKRKPTTSTMSGHVYAEVPEIGREELSPVLSWTSVNINREGCLRTCAEWNGRLFIPVMDYFGNIMDSLPENASNSLGNAYFACEILGKNGLSKSEESILMSVSAEPGTGPYSVKPITVIETNQRHHEKIAQKCANGLLLVDQVVWREVPSVMLSLSPAPFDNAIKLSVSFGAHGFDCVADGLDVPCFEPELWTRNFSLSEMERLRWHAGGLSLWGLDSRIAVLGEEPNPVDSEADYRQRALRYVLHKTHDVIGNLSVTNMENWLMMREAYETAYKVGTPVSDEVIETLARFIPAIEDARVRSNMERSLDIIETYREDPYRVPRQLSATSVCDISLP